MKKFHISLAVKDIKESVAEYSAKFGLEPEVVIDAKYALWRMEALNFSISQKPEIAGQMRHLGFESPIAKSFTTSIDCNGILWEDFTEEIQKEEIETFYGNIIK
jgi:hypothetical protein